MPAAPVPHRPTAHRKDHKPHDPPLVKTAKGYAGEGNPDKQFAELTMGRVELPEGEHQLIIRATKIPTETVGDLRGVMLRSVD